MKNFLALVLILLVTMSFITSAQQNEGKAMQEEVKGGLFSAGFYPK
jgi:hypothetical protein